MNGLGGLEGWRWIFIMLGIITIIAGAIGWLLIVDFPDKATFLSEQERQHGQSQLLNLGFDAEL
jgi:predicted MFS family arabinose efflux permease